MYGMARPNHGTLEGKKVFCSDVTFSASINAMAFPERIETGVPAPDLFALGSLTFEKPDEEKFPALRLARECLRAGGAACTVFNGANEEAVAAFLREEIPFGEIAVRVERALDRLAGLPADCIEDIWEADRRARESVRASREVIN